MKKKTLIAIIAAALLVICGAVTVFFLTQRDKQKINNSSSSNVTSVSSEEQVVYRGNVSIGEVTAAAGQELKIPISIAENPGFAAYKIDFSFDASKFAFVRYEAGGLLNQIDSNDNGEGTLTVIGCENGDFTDNGVMFYLVFKPADGIAAGEYDISVLKCEMSNWDENMVYPEFSAGKIIVK